MEVGRVVFGWGVEVQMVNQIFEEEEVVEWSTEVCRSVLDRIFLMPGSMVDGRWPA